MPQTTPAAPPAEPEVEPRTLPPDQPSRKAEPDPFNPDWPDDLPEPEPKAKQFSWVAGVERSGAPAERRADFEWCFAGAPLRSAPATRRSSTRRQEPTGARYLGRSR